MANDPMRIRAHLAAQRRQLRQLDLVEQAEELLRRHYRDRLIAELLEAERELLDARRHQSTLLGGPELAHLVLAEEYLGAVGKRVATLKRRSAEEQHAVKQARKLFASRRNALLRNITQLRLLQRRSYRSEPSPQARRAS